MNAIQSALNLVVPPVGLFFLVMIWPMLAVMSTMRWMLGLVFQENMRGKVVLITGASSGIGEHAAYEYAKKGAVLSLVARREDRLRVVADRTLKLGARDVRVIAADVSKEADCKKFIEETVNQFGHLDHLVNNAGVTHSFLFEEATDTASFAPMMDTTFWGNIYPTYYALPHLRRSRGKIIITSSVAAWLPYPRMSIYNAAKAALFNFYDTLRIEVGPTIGVTIVTPGWIESEMTMGKFMTDRGDMTIKEDQRDLHIGPWPVAYAEQCAKAMVSGALRGQCYVRVPYWYTVLLLYRVFAPEVLEWSLHLLYVSKPFGAEKSLSKTLVNMSGAKKVIYPGSIQKDQ